MRAHRGKRARPLREVREATMNHDARGRRVLGVVINEGRRRSVANIDKGKRKTRRRAVCFVLAFSLSRPKSNMFDWCHTFQKFAKNWLANGQKTTFLQVSGNNIPVMIFCKLGIARAPVLPTTTPKFQKKAASETSPLHSSQRSRSCRHYLNRRHHSNGMT